MSQNDIVPGNENSPSKPIYKKMKMTCCTIPCLLFSIGTYILDIGSDIYVAVKHYEDGNKIYFNLTVLFVVLPAFIMATASFRWYYRDNLNPDLKVSRGHWIIRIIFSILLMAPPLRCAEALYYAWKSHKSERVIDKINYTRRVIYDNTDASFLRLFEAFSECGPQVILNIYIISENYCAESIHFSYTEIVQLSSIVISLFSMASAIVSYSRNLRESLENKTELTWCISIFPFLWRFFDLAARILTLGLFASVLLPYFFLLCALHFGIMLVWINFMKTDFCDGNKFAEFGYNLLLSFMCIFGFINPTDKSTQKRYTFYYSLLFLEHAVLLAVWYHHSCFQQHRLGVILIVFVCFILAIIIMVIYYVLLHPVRGILFREIKSKETFETEIGMSKEMSTAMIQNVNQTEMNNANEEKIECSQL